MIFKSKYTEWIPFGFYVHDYNDYLVMARRNKKNGMLQFKSIRVSGKMFQVVTSFITTPIVSIEQQWELLTKGSPHE